MVRSPSERKRLILGGRPVRGAFRGRVGISSLSSSPPKYKYAFFAAIDCFGRLYRRAIAYYSAEFRQDYCKVRCQLPNQHFMIFNRSLPTQAADPERIQNKNILTGTGIALTMGRSSLFWAN
jgi:hypothetical protein